MHDIFVYFVRGGFRTKLKCMRKVQSKSENPQRSATVRKFHAYERSESPGYENWVRTEYSGFTVHDSEVSWMGDENVAPWRAFRIYSVVQWNWFSVVTGCTWVACISDVREPIFTAPGCTIRPMAPQAMHVCMCCMCVRACIPCVRVCQRKTKDRADGMTEKSVHSPQRDSG